MRELVDIFKSIAEETRLRLLNLLLRHCDTEICACELIDALEKPQYTISRHMSILRKAGLVADRRKGVWVFYALSPQAESLKVPLLELLDTLVSKEEVFKKDLLRMRKRLAKRMGNKCVCGHKGKPCK